jgi:oligosaccharyltransferase complex subunit epsilon
MAKKPASQATPVKAPPAAAAKPPPPTTKQTSSSSTPIPSAKPTTTISNKSSPQEIALHVWNRYIQDTPSRTFILDIFLVFLVLVGAVQFFYCILAGNYVCTSSPLFARY